MSIQSPNPPAEETLRLREYWGVLRHRKWTVIVVTLLFVGGALLYTKQLTPTYGATSEVLATNPLVGITTSGQTALNMDTESQFVTSDDVTKCASLILADPSFRTDLSASTIDLDKLCASSVLVKMPLPATLDKHVKVVFPQTATVLQITYSDNLRPASPAGAQAFALGYIHIKTVHARLQLIQLRKPLNDQLGELTTNLNDLDKQINDAISKNFGTKPSQGDLQTVSNLQQQRAVVQQQISSLNAQLLDLDFSKINPPQLLLPAKLPKAPSSPNLLLNVALGLFVGLAFGIGLAFLRERLDDGLRGRADFEENLGAPVLAVIPRVPGWKKKQEPRLVTLEQPKSAVAEAYRTLRTSVLFLSVQRGLKTIMVCSPTAGEGKTTTAANLAVALADAGKRVILVSADLRKPRVHRFFSLNPDVGLSSALAGEVKPWEALQDPHVDNLRVMPSGPVPARPAELLSSEQMGELIMELREVADFVIIDTAPVLLVADALALAPLVDGVLFVADSAVTSRSAVSHSRDQLDQVGATVLGGVFNNFDPAKAKSYPYYGHYGYRYRRYGAYGYSYGAAGTPTPAGVAPVQAVVREGWAEPRSGVLSRLSGGTRTAREAVTTTPEEGTASQAEVEQVWGTPAVPTAGENGGQAEDDS